jgi:hypothetical protein
MATTRWAFFAVLVREDVLAKVSEREQRVDLMRFVHNVTLGDQAGLVKRQGAAVMDRSTRRRESGRRRPFSGA